MLSGFFKGNQPNNNDVITGVGDTNTDAPEQVLKYNILYTGHFSTLPLYKKRGNNGYFSIDEEDIINEEDDDDDDDEREGLSPYRVLCDTNGSIEWVDTGITYQGDVQNDRIVSDNNGIVAGVFTVPVNTIVSYKGGKGVLTFCEESKAWTITFATGFYIRSMTSVHFDPYTLTFLKRKKIVFHDGCVSDFRKSRNYEGYRYTYYTPADTPCSNSYNWSNHQLTMWLQAIYKFSDDVYDNISIYNITGLHWNHLDVDALWELGLNEIEISQVQSDIKHQENVVCVHNMLYGDYKTSI
jgi:hypothetical protein